MLPPDWTTPYTEKSTAVTRSSAVTKALSDCDYDIDCPPDSICVDGKCVPEEPTTSEEPTSTPCDCPPPFTCDANGDCVYIPTTPSKPKNICVYVPPSKTTGSLPVTEGSSTTPNSGQLPDCDDDIDCMPGFICVNGKCVWGQRQTPEEPTSTPCDCPPPFTCDANGDCVFIPTSPSTSHTTEAECKDEDCPEGFHCDPLKEYKCIADVEGECDEENCPSPSYCDPERGICIFVPVTTVTPPETTGTPCDCPPPFTCDANGDCVFIPTPPSTSHTTGSSPVTRAKPECEGDTDCPPDFVCVDGKCVSEEITTSEEPTSTPCDCPPPFTCDANGNCDCPEGFHCDPLKEYKCIADVEGCDDENCPFPSYCDPERDVCIFVPVTTVTLPETTGTPCDCPPPFTCDANGDCVFIPTPPPTSHTTEKSECEDDTDCPPDFICVDGECVPEETTTSEEPTSTPACDISICPPPFECTPEGKCILVYPTSPQAGSSKSSSPVTKVKPECEADTDCPPDFICVDGECVPEETTTSEEPTKAECKDEDCPEGCDDENCPFPSYCDPERDVCIFVPVTTVTTPETTGTPCDCPPPFTCDANGDCVFIPTPPSTSHTTEKSECETDSDCPPDFVCVDGECVPEETTTSEEPTSTPCDCPPPFTCDANGDCVFIPTPPPTNHTTGSSPVTKQKSECETDTDCPPDFICVDGECVPEETTTSEEPTSTPCDCPPPFTCDANGDCVFIPTPPSTSQTTGSSPVTKEKSECETDSDCPPDFICVDGECVPEETTTSEEPTSTPCDCPPPFTCDANGDCVFIPTPPSTSHTTESECKDEECPEGYHCDPLKEYRCIAIVQDCSDENCPSPAHCDYIRDICVFEPTTTTPPQTSVTRRCNEIICPYPFHCDPVDDMSSNVTCDSSWCKFPYQCDNHGQCIPPPGQTLPTLPPLATRDPFLTTITPPYTIPVSPSGRCRDWCDPPYFCYEQLCVHVRYGPGDPLCDELPKRTTLKRN
ncbi:unnamed protein product [Callosobruchus maculatus]|uniref:EGF-like domain-containing protein n=1 Tax=Callosobruchus maculatus TaxID=64391 RepID=A0A653BRT7_CALMS|nr:unnamed protein product [Callosobruchus maculatus]